MNRVGPKVHCKALDVWINPVDETELISVMERAAQQSAGLLIAGHNLHSVYLYHTDPEFRRFYEAASIILPDGAPVLWDYNLTGRQSTAKRIGSTDWIPLVGRIESLQSVCVIGATEQSNRSCVRALQEIAPAKTISGISGYPWNKTKADESIARVSHEKPNLILVGLGMPLQEAFALQLAQNAPSSVIATVGGAIDQIAGVQRNAPRWLGKLGLEWLWRLVSQPRRLWRRYLVEPWRLLLVRGRQVLLR